MMDELYREELYKELSTFARANRKALRSAEQWLDEFDRGDFMAAWETAKNEVPTVDWQKIVYIAWWATDKKLYECKFEFIEKADLRKWCEEGQVYFLCDLMSSGRTATNEYSNLYLIRSALDKGKAVAGSLNDTSNIVLSDEEQSVLEELAGRPGETLTIRRLSKHLKTPESTIRDRVNRLKKMGLADKKEGRHGFFATDISIEWYNIRWNK